jgi:hypothetical protein
MIDDARRRDAQRLRRAQELADEVRDRQVELQDELRARTFLASVEPIPIGSRRRTGAPSGAPGLPDDVC